MSRNIKHTHFDSLAFCVCVYFAANPEEELTAVDIGQKWDQPIGAVYNSLVRVRDRKLITTQMRTGRLFYMAGPRLMEQIRGAA